MTPDDNKAVVRRFNTEVIEQGNRTAFDALMDRRFVNRSAPPGMPDSADGMWYMFDSILRPALAGMTVTIHDQVAEGDKVTTRKTIAGTHSGALLGVEPTGQAVSIEVIDIVRVADGRYAEHWGVTTLPEVLAQLSAA